MNSIDKDICEMILKCSSLGLVKKEPTDAQSYLEYNEPGLAFEMVLVNMYEYGIQIDKEFYNKIEKIALRMSLNSETYTFMAELIKPKTD